MNETALHPAPTTSPHQLPESAVRGQPRPAARLAMLHAMPLLPPDEVQRLARLREANVLEGGADGEFERLARLARTVCGSSMAALSFVDDSLVHYKATAGFDAAPLPRDRTLCARAVLAGPGGLQVADTGRLPWFDPLLHGAPAPPVRAYAAMPLGNGEGSAIGAICVMDEVPRRFSDAQLEALEHLAASATSTLELRRQLRVAVQTDRLTGLPNWFHFESEFHASRPTSGVVCFVRLRSVSQITSAHGFRVADALIQQAAARLRSAAEQDGGAVGRIKRGLFVLFFPDPQPQVAARSLAQALQAQLQAPYVVGDLSLACPVHLGVAGYPHDGASLDEVVNAADTALQLALERDEPVAFFDRRTGTAAIAHYRLEPQLRAALERNEFVNLYQPQVDLASGRLVGVEALVRWRHPERGLLPPSEFVPALEATGLIREAGRQILLHAVADWKSWRRAGLPAPRVAVNVAAAQLRDGELLEHLREALDAIGGEPGALGLEVTESVLIGNMGRAIDILAQVRALGVPVAIDDFGTGYSSLSYLVSLPVDEVKIDRSFISRVATDPAYRGIVATCISLARNLRLQVVAEGVETVEQARELRALRCDFAQGFLYGVPVPAESMAARLRSGA